VNALLLVDLQNDFFPGGSLGIKEGGAIIPYVNRLLEKDWDLVVASKDLHPEDHESFASNHGKEVGEVIDLHGLEQRLWPDHCVEGSKGAEFHPGWDTSKVDEVVYKGTNPHVDSYSAFFDNGKKNATGLDDILQENGIKKIYCAGLATDYCVKYTVKHALELGYEVYVIEEACKGVNIKPDDSKEALSEMFEEGAHVISIDELNSMRNRP